MLNLYDIFTVKRRNWCVIKENELIAFGFEAFRIHKGCSEYGVSGADGKVDKISSAPSMVNWSKKDPEFSYQGDAV